MNANAPSYPYTLIHPPPNNLNQNQALVRLVDAPRGPLLQALEELWFLYLDAWRERGRYPIGYCFLGGRHVDVDRSSHLSICHLPVSARACWCTPCVCAVPQPHTHTSSMTMDSGGTGRFLKDFEALPEVQALRKREGRKTRGVPAAAVAALARIGVTLYVIRLWIDSVTCIFCIANKSTHKLVLKPRFLPHPTPGRGLTSMPILMAAAAIGAAPPAVTTTRRRMGRRRTTSRRRRRWRWTGSRAGSGSGDSGKGDRHGQDEETWSCPQTPC